MKMQPKINKNPNCSLHGCLYISQWMKNDWILIYVENVKYFLNAN